MRGLVIRNTGSWYVVRTDDGQLVDSKIKGNFRLKGIRSTNPVAVGDFVQITVNAEGTAFITEIEDRKNYIIRKASNLSKQSHIIAANVDQAFLIVTVSHPETSTTFIDRFLASAEAYRVPGNLVFNKVDLYSEDELRYLDGLVNLYTHIGYPCYRISAANGEGVDALPCLFRLAVPRYRRAARQPERPDHFALGPFRCRKVHFAEHVDTRPERTDGRNIRRARHGHAHHDIQRNVQSARRRLCHRHPGHQRIRHVRLRKRRNGTLLPRNFPDFGRLQIQQLHAHP